MAVLGKNTCTPQRIYGPLPQTLFLGCSVQSFNVTAGWGQQSSTLTVQLVEDPCVGPKIWWDESLNRQTGNIADPGFLAPDPGVAVYFRMEEDPDNPTSKGGFEYCGILQSWVESTNAQGNPTYTVQVTDPRVILENTQLILDSYPGPTSGVWNLINVYAYVENIGTSCPSSPAGGIGGVTQDNIIGNIANDRGIVWNDVKCALHTLTASTNKSFTKSQYNSIVRDARLVYVGPTPSQEGYGVIEADSQIQAAIFQTLPNANLYNHDYLLDLTEFDQVISPPYYRIGGSATTSMSEVLDQVAQDASCDYYLELLPVKVAGKVIKIIKVRLVSRNVQPAMGKLDEFIAARQNAAENANGGVLSYVKGEEVRNEDTSTYIMGGNRRDPYVTDNTQMLPFFGVNADGGLIEASIDGNGEYTINLDARRLNTTLYNPFPANFIAVTESELMAAMGDIDSWKSVTIAKGGDVATWANANTIFSQAVDANAAKLAIEGKGPPVRISIPQTEANSGETDFSLDPSKDVEKVFSEIKAFADEYYGKQFLVNATSFVCVAQDLETGRFRFSHDPSTDGCWVGDTTVNILGLQHNSPASDFFRDDVGRYQTIVRFPLTGAFTMGGAGGSIVSDPSKLGQDNFISDGSSVWVKAEVDSRFVRGTPLDSNASTISFVVKIPTALTSRTEENYGFDEGHAGFGLLLDISGLGTINSAKVQGGRGSYSMSAMHVPISPIGVLVPVLDNTEVYGPWGVAGLPGQVAADQDEGFVPWEYGSDQVMFKAGLQKVANAVAQMRKGERGSVTVAGFPNIPLGAELFSVDTANPPTSQGTQKYVETRVLSIGGCNPTISYYYCSMNAWFGDFGPSVTNVNVTVGPNGFTTEYQFSTFSPRFGTFNNANASRLKEIGQRRLQANRNIRAAWLRNQRTLFAQSRSRQRLLDQVGKSARAPKSSHELYIGHYPTEAGVSVESIASKDAALGFTNNAAWADTAMMSMDGLLRPVSRGGDGGLTPYVTKLGGCNSGTPQASDPPINERRELLIDTEYLDPVSNAGDALPTDRDSNTSSPSGHDIEALGRLSSPPAASFAIAPNEEAANGQGYASDYRFFALKGPLMIQQFGYDLNNKPVPNQADSAAAAENGTFTTSSLTDKFLSNFMANPKTWPVAPLDLRLDRERGVWTTPPPPRPLHATNEGCIKDEPASDVNNIKPNTVDENGAAIGSPTIDVEWPWTPSPPSGIGKFPSYYDNIDCKHYAFPIFRLDVQQQDEYEANNTDLVQDINRIVFGSGFSVEAQTPGCVNSVYVQFTGAGSGSGSGAGIGIRNRACGYSTGELAGTGEYTQVENITFNNMIIGTGVSGEVIVEPFLFYSGFDFDLGPDYGIEFRNLQTTIFSGNLLLSALCDEVDDGCCSTVVGYPAFFSGTSGCSNETQNLMIPANRVRTLNFGNNINLAYPPGTEPNQIDETLTISALSSVSGYIQYTGDGFCGTVEQKQSFETMILAGGLVLEQTGVEGNVDCSAKIISYPEKISGYASTATWCEDEPDVAFFTRCYPTWEFGRGLVVSEKNALQDDFILQIESLINVAGSGKCDPEGTQQLPIGVADLVFGTGFILSQSNADAGEFAGELCSMHINSILKISGTSPVNSPGDPDILTSFETLGFAGNLDTIIDEENCGVIISGFGTPWSGDSSCGSASTGLLYPSLITVSTGLKISAPEGIQRNSDGYGVNAPLTLISDIKMYGNSGCGTKGKNGIGPFIFEEISFGDGIVVETGEPSSSEAVCDVYISAPSYISGKDTCGDTSWVGYGDEDFSRLIFGTGLQVRPYGDLDYDCSYIIDSTLKISKDSKCVGVEDGNAAISESSLNKLIISSGLRLIDNGECTFTLAGGLNFERSCDRPAGATWMGTNQTDGFYSKIVIGSGLQGLQTDDSDECAIVISNFVNWDGDSASNKYGWPKKTPTGANRSTTPAPSPCAVSGDPWDGPYDKRLQPQIWTNPIAGKGIGIASCNNSCDGEAIIFNSTVVAGSGLRTGGASCAGHTTAQVGAWQFDGNFYVTTEETSAADPFKGGAGVDGSDGTLSVKIGLNIDEDDAGKTLSFVTGLSVTTGTIDGTTVVTQVSSSCCEFTVKSTCAGKWIITDIPTNGCGCAGGAAPAPGPPGP